MPAVTFAVKKSSLKKTVCYMIAQQLPEEDIQEFKTMFVKLDKNGDGFLSRLEFKDGTSPLTKLLTENSI